MQKGVDYIGVGIGAVIINPERKIFLSQRGSAAQNEKGKWECPGGGLEFGHSFADTIIREVKEEFGFAVQPIEQLEPFNHLIPNEHQHWVALCFVCIVKNGAPKILEPDKSSTIDWFTPDEMEKMDLTLTAQHRLKQIRQKYPHGIPDFYKKS